MNKTLSIFLALFAGLVGGLLTRYMAPAVAFAQDQAPAAKEIRAQSFTLVDSLDQAVGTFTYEALPGRVMAFSQGQQSPDVQALERALRARTPSRIVLRDANGREIWSAGGSVVRPLSER